MPKVSVIMAVYNGKKYVAEAIESILSQTFTDFEFVIVDDASNDGTGAVLEQYRQRDSRIVLFNNDRNQERAVSRNIGINNARGEYVAFVDADDIAHSQKLEKQVAFLEIHRDVAFVSTSWYSIDAEDRVIALEELPETNTSEVVHIMCRPAIMARRESVIKVGGYRSEFIPAEDYDLWLRVAEIGGAANIHEPLFRYRIHPDSSTVRQRLQMDIATSMALWLAKKRDETGCEIASEADRADVAKAWEKMRNAS